MNAKDRIIVALDVPSASAARSIVDELQSEVGAFKIGLQLFTAAGTSLVSELVGRGVRLFLDLKFHDIPNTVAKASIEVARTGVWMFNVHSLGGGEMMRRTVAEVREFCERERLPHPKIIGVTILTSSGSETLAEVGIKGDMSSQVLNLARLTAECGLDGVVASPLEIELIRKQFGAGFLIVTPGIRPGTGMPDPRSGTSDDQKRVMTPARAVAAGSDYLVIGRPIIDAADRRAAVRDIISEIENG
ncbi:MAG: orotidine-5'-phosphate decarboxylase [Acidobacteria bacterium]|nr:orotidine-5'-phosphate decarboxylase [Acidobacteriota bacterium]